MSMKLMKQQRGWSPLGLLVVLMVVSFFGMCAFRMVPAYMDDRLLQATLMDLGGSIRGQSDFTDHDIRSHMSKAFLINNLRNFSERDVEIHRDEDHVQVSMKYEVRLPIIYNIDAVLSFHNVWDSARPDECCKPPRV